MRLLAAKLAVAALASLAAATTPKSGKPTILRVKKSDGAVKRVAFDGAATLDELHERAHADELFSDDACTRACTADDLVHGAVVYERPMEKEDEPEEAAAEAFFSPYPELQKKSSLRAKRRQKNLRANTWKELLREREGVFYVKSFERVCDMCRLSQDCVEELSGRGAHAAWLIGRRGVRKENATTFAESAYVVGARDDDVFEIAQLCGLEVVGVAVVRADADGDDKSILLTPYEVALVSELQVEAMRRCENLKRPFSFPTLIIAPRSSGGLATEAFEASELTVQMAAERVLESSGDQPTEADARVRTRDVFFPRPRFLRLFDCGGWSRPRSPESDGGVRGDGVLTSTTPPRAVVTVASTPLRHAGRRRRPRGREGHRRALPVPGRARRHPRHKSYLGVGLPPITKSQGQEARAGARGAFEGSVRQEGPDEEAPRHRCIGRGARHPRQGRRERCLRCGEAAADGPGRSFAGEGSGCRGGVACYRVGWVIGRSFYISPFPGRRRPRRRRRGAVYTPPPLRRPGEGCLERLSNQTPISN